jgi:hypothetical protein
MAPTPTESSDQGPSERDVYRSPDGIPERAHRLGRFRWTMIFLVVVAFVFAILIFGQHQ